MFVPFCKERQQRQGRKRWERLRAAVEDNTALDELTDEELRAIIEGVRNAGRASRSTGPVGKGG